MLAVLCRRKKLYGHANNRVRYQWEDKLLEKIGFRGKLAEAKDKVKHSDSKSDKVKSAQIPVMT